MTQVCCPHCRLRFAGAAAESLSACPQCGEPPRKMVRAAQVIGFQLRSRDHHLPDDLLRAVAAVQRDRRDTPS
jgi:hypothetical protein